MPCLVHDPLRCIIPPYITERLAQSKTARIRELALRALALAERIRGRREVLAALPAFAAASAGEKRRTIYDGKSDTDLPGELVRGEGDDPVDDTSVNEAYDGLGDTYDFYKAVFNRNSLDDNGFRLDATVHYGDHVNNAFFDGARMLFGDGDGILYNRFTIALDVIGHELTHGVTAFTSRLVYQDQAGALNESFSDVFGSLVKQYKLGQDAESADWLIGAGLFTERVQGKALRSMLEPGTAFDDPELGKDPQPAHMSDYKDTGGWDNGGVHLNSGIPNRAFALAARAIGGNAWEDAGHIWYTTLLRLHPTAQFQDAADLSYQAAGEKFGPNSKQQEAVEEAWAEVGITVTRQPAVRAVPARRTQRAAARAGGEGGGATPGEAELSRVVERVADQLGRKLLEVLDRRMPAGKR
jgi:Zn-dependent metalloprotease